MVDDDLRLRDLLKRYLSEQGFAVDTVADATAMDRQLQRVRYDLMVLDLMLPELDGYEVLAAIRKDKNRVPVIILTARGEEADKVRGFRLDADQYVTKPFGVLELLERVGALLRRSNAAEQVASRARGSHSGAVLGDRDVWTVGPAVGSGRRRPARPPSRTRPP